MHDVLLFKHYTHNRLNSHSKCNTYAYCQSGLTVLLCRQVLQCLLSSWSGPRSNWNAASACATSTPKQGLTLSSSELRVQSLHWTSAIGRLHEHSARVDSCASSMRLGGKQGARAASDLRVDEGCCRQKHWASGEAYARLDHWRPPSKRILETLGLWNVNLHKSLKWLIPFETRFT